ncbi:hypothetical protein FLONG3_1255 [Fusarium longipes]|uniref:Amidoligase enzyme n=1 Tax=Fusarium longipes TaxID=694270 RepID=A0A395T7L3_9HYPO|nr:hypothetical protein FLONG3_1255 [Fusarium longipes]
MLEAELKDPHSIQAHSGDSQTETRPGSSLTGWKVEFDGHVRENQANQCEWIGVKLTSPKFQAGGLDLQKELKKVLLILNRQYLTVPNSETRLKVVVYLHNYHSTLDQMKTTAAFIWMVDPLLSDVHPDHCGPNSIASLGLQYSNIVRDSPLHLDAQLDSAVETADPWNNHLSLGRRPLELLSHPGELTEAKYNHGVDKILGACAIDDLISIIDVPIQDIKDYPQASPAYEFNACSESQGMAIWFNQHCGTLDFVEIEQWAAFCVGIIKLSLENTVSSRLKSHPGLKCSSTIFSFLDENGLHGLADHYRARLDTPKIPDLKHWSFDKALFCRHPKSYVGSDSLSDGSFALSASANPFRVYERQFTSANSVDCSYSFGIELEMYTPSRTNVDSQPQVESPLSDLLIDISDMDPSSSSWVDPSPEDDRQVGALSDIERHDQIAEVITKEGPLAWRHCAISQDTPSWRRELAKHGIVPISGIEPDYQTWTVLNDPTLAPLVDWRGYQELCGVEVVSAVLGDTPKGWEEVVDVLSILRNNFRLLVTSSCGFHIHVAKGTEMLPFHLLRKVCVLVACTENIIFSLCQTRRRENLWSLHILGKGSSLYENYTESWTHMSVPDEFWKYVPYDMNSHPRLLGALKKMWMSGSADHLQLLLRPDVGLGKGCISLSKCNADPNNAGQYQGTVEFRFLEGTLDPELIVRWGQLMTALFRFADKAPVEAWPVFLATVSQCQPSGRCDINILKFFLTSLGLNDDFDFWADRIKAVSEVEVPNRGEPPDQSQGFLSRIGNSQITALRDKICRRERRIPSLIKNNGIGEEPESLSKPRDRAKAILEKAGFSGESVERGVDLQGGHAGQTREEAQEGDVDERSSYLLSMLDISRREAKKAVERHHPV